jgi:transposase
VHIASIGIDLGKTTFHLVALGERSKVLVRKKFSRTQLLAHTVNLPPSLIGLEACSGAHFLGAALREQGHEVRLIPAQFVKPYRKSNKNDFLDAEAIAEAMTKQNMRFVPIKTQEQLDVQAMHRVRDRLVQRRTALINEIRGFLLERGITFPAQPTHLRQNLPTVVEDCEQNLTPPPAPRLCSRRRVCTTIGRNLGPWFLPWFRWHRHLSTPRHKLRPGLQGP